MSRCMAAQMTADCNPHVRSAEPERCSGIGEPPTHLAAEQLVHAGGWDPCLVADPPKHVLQLSVVRGAGGKRFQSEHNPQLCVLKAWDSKWNGLCMSSAG